MSEVEPGRNVVFCTKVVAEGLEDNTAELAQLESLSLVGDWSS